MLVLLSFVCKVRPFPGRTHVRRNALVCKRLVRRPVGFLSFYTLPLLVTYELWQVGVRPIISLVLCSFSGWCFFSFTRGIEASPLIKKWVSAPRKERAVFRWTLDQRNSMHECVTNRRFCVAFVKVLWSLALKCSTWYVQNGSRVLKTITLIWYPVPLQHSYNIRSVAGTIWQKTD